MVEVYDDVLSKRLSDEIENYVLSDVSWRMKPATVKNGNARSWKDKRVNEYIQFGKALSTDIEYYFMNSILNGISKQSKHVIAGTHRSKFNLLTRNHKNYEDSFNSPHVDIFVPHYVVLYYVNDSDGDTFIFEETSDEYEMARIPEIENFTIKKRITPRKNRAILFDGRYFHTSSHPFKSPLRIVMNIDIESKDIIIK